jgi:hypothetical protein
MSEPRYRFGPLESRGVILGLTAGQVVSVGSGLVLCVAALRALPPPFNLGAALVMVAAGLAVAFAPVGGRSPQEWLPVLGVWLRSGAARRPGWRNSAPLSSTASQPPPALAGCEVVGHRGRGLDRPLGVLVDRQRGTLTAVMAVAGRGFPLLDPAEKERRISAWSAVLAGLARQGTAVHRLQWVERVQAGARLADSLALAERLDPTAPGPAVASYASLLADAGPASPERETLLALSVTRSRSRIRGGRRGQRQDHQEDLERLSREVALLRSNLGGAEIEVESVLGPVALGRCLASAWNGRSVGWSGPWPMALEERWDRLRADGAWHATYWVAEWPRSDVGPDFMVPLLLLASAVRSVAVTMQPVDPRQAAREVESARTTGAADEELRRRSGFLATARRQRQAEGVARREVELADGHVDYRFSGYLTVSAADPDALERSCSEVEQAAGQARLELRRLYGQQGEAFTFTLPAGRGLR